MPAILSEQEQLNTAALIQDANREDLVDLLERLFQIHGQSCLPVVEQWRKLLEQKSLPKPSQTKIRELWQNITNYLIAVLKKDPLSPKQEEDADELLAKLQDMEEQKQIPDDLRKEIIRALTCVASACIPPYEDVLWEILEDFIHCDEDRIVMYAAVLEYGDLDFAGDLLAALAYKRSADHIAELTKRIVLNCQPYLRSSLCLDLLGQLELPADYMEALHKKLLPLLDGQNPQE